MKIGRSAEKIDLDNREQFRIRKRSKIARQTTATTLSRVGRDAGTCTVAVAGHAVIYLSSESNH